MPQLPSNFASNIASSSTDMLGQLAPLATIVIGVLLAVLVVGSLISFFHHR